MEQALLVMLPALAGGLIQGVTGFGAGIVIMIFLPQLLPVTQAAGISTAICTVLCMTMAWRYRKHAQLKQVVGPAVLYLAVSSACVLVAQGIDQQLMKGILGAFLVVLALYFLLAQSAANFKPEGFVAVLCIVISGLCDGLFGVGGPLMVIYFMARTKDSGEYLGTIQAFFALATLYITIFRFATGVITPLHLPLIAAGIVGVLAGLTVANYIVSRLNPSLVRQLTYAVIGLSGLWNLASVTVLA